MTSAIVLAAGKGTRMHSNLAKTMHKILDKPMLEYIDNTLDRLNVENRVYVVGHDKETIMNYFKDKVDYATQEQQLGTAHAVSTAIKLKGLQGKTLIINGDCPLISDQTYESLLEKAQKYPLVLLTTKLSDPANYGRIIKDESGLVERIVERKDCDSSQLLINEVNAGIYCVENELLWKYLPEISNDNAAKEFYITDLIEIFRKHNHDVSALVVEDENEVQGVNSQVELVNATKYLQNKINLKWMNNGVTIISPETTYIGMDVEIGEDTIIYPNVRIEGKTKIGKNNVIEEGCYFFNATIKDNNQIISTRITDSTFGSNNVCGPNAHLRNNCEIGDNCRIGNYVEMKNTIFSDESKCAHLTYIGDCTVGKHCNFGCGVVTVNYDGKNKYHSTIGNNVFVGSNVNIISPVTIQDNTVLAAGSTITKDVNQGDMAIARVRQENKVGYGFKYLNK